jgi:hypothetical protein
MRRKTVAQLRAEFVARYGRQPRFSDEQANALIERRWPLELEEEPEPDRHPLDPAEVARRVAAANRPPRGHTSLAGRIEGEPEPDYIPDELYRERLGMAFGYLDSYGPRTRQRTMAEVTDPDGPPTYSQ